MKLKLKENPWEWRKFTMVLLVIPIVITGLLWRRGVAGLGAFSIVFTIAVLIAIICVLWPRPFRPVYRVGMTISFRIGQVMSMLLLTVFFLLVVTPMGLLLRLAGKDLLQLKATKAESFWQKSRPNNRFDRLF